MSICAILDNDDYQISSLKRLLREILDRFIRQNKLAIKNSYKDFCLDFPEEFKNLVNYQNSEDYDKISKIDKTLNDTKVIMLQNIEKVLKRGEKIEDLVKRSNDLSKTSKQFYKTSKKLNMVFLIVTEANQQVSIRVLIVVLDPKIVKIKF